MASPTITQALKSALPPIRTPFLDKRSGEVTTPWVNWFQTLVNKLNPVIPQYLAGSHALRINTDPSAYPNGSIFHETDRNLYYIAENAVWVYLSGTYIVNQEDIDGLNTSLGSHDAALLLWVQDYGHLLEWNGSAFQWGPGESGSGYSVPFVNAPTATGWNAADGSDVLTLQADGSLIFTTVPNTAGSYFRQ